MTTTAERLAETLWSDGVESAAASTFILLDAAQDAAIYPQLRRAGTDATVLPLYDGAAAAEMAAVAPYLVQLSPGSPLLDWVCSVGWGGSWGVLLASAAPAGAVRAHLRTLTRVRTEDGRVLLFRFYDPRTLTAFLPVCDAAQLSEFFGPVAWFAGEDEHGAVLRRFSLRDGALSESRVEMEDR